MKKVCAIGVLLLFLIPLKSQFIIGLHKDKIDDEIKSYYPSFSKDNTFVNHTYNYLKYNDRLNDQTLLVFLSDMNICTSTKLICDYSELNKVKKRLKQYKQVGKNKWMYKTDSAVYFMQLNHEEWFFSLFTSKKK